jgi:hypothetical protein
MLTRTLGSYFSSKNKVNKVRNGCFKGFRGKISNFGKVKLENSKKVNLLTIR